MTSVDLCFTFDVVTFGQNWHHLYSISARGNGLFDDTQMRVIGSVQPEISMKIPRYLSKKLRAKLPATTRGYSMVKFFELEASPEEGQSLQQKDKKRKKGKTEKKLRNEKPKDRCR